jgi:hypothetical protein
LFVPLLSCQSATQIEVVLSTDLPCDQVSMTSVTVGRPEKLEGKFPSMSTTMCEPGSKSLGSITLVPSGEADEEFAIRIVTGTTGVSPDDCVREGNKGCIIARRSLRYLPNRKLFLPIPMYAECKGVYCEPGTTCHRAGVCRPASIDDPERCATPGACDQRALPPVDSRDDSAGSAGTQGAAGMSAAGGSGAGKAGMGGMGEAGTGAGEAGNAGLGGASGSDTGGSGTGDSGTGGAGMGGVGGVGGAVAGDSGTSGSGTGGVVSGGAGTGGSSTGGAGTGGPGSGGAGTGGSGVGGSGAGGTGVGGAVNGIVAADADIEKQTPACTIIDLSGYPSECYNPAGTGVEPGITIRAELPSADGGSIVIKTFTISSELSFLALYDIVPNAVQKATVEFPPGAPTSCLANTQILTNPTPLSLPAPGAVRFNSGGPWGGVDFPRHPPPDGPYITSSGGDVGPNPCKSFAGYLYSPPAAQQLTRSRSAPLAP